MCRFVVVVFRGYIENGMCLTRVSCLGGMQCKIPGGSLNARNNCSKFGSHMSESFYFLLRWRHNGHGSVSNHQPYDCLLNRLFRHKSKEPSKLRVTGLCAGNSPGTGEFPAQMASNAENVSFSWRHHVGNELYSNLKDQVSHYIYMLYIYIIYM